MCLSIHSAGTTFDVVTPFGRRGATLSHIEEPNSFAKITTHSYLQRVNLPTPRVIVRLHYQEK